MHECPALPFVMAPEQPDIAGRAYDDVQDRDAGRMAEPALPAALALYANNADDGDESESEGDGMGQPEYADFTSDSEEDSEGEIL
ncbi:hypothetical protein EW146_g1248 [Bondarzewia mesenterica]|uniref:Uncharacterized protein n=1 Tax=Bondarzewia mesenterica TaxID=1095465 RepID=A0A4S4M4D8_9AGAM|nr:hypothetical protein EW146_g1248 [Bondarzewia mesenterica]